MRARVSRCFRHAETGSDAEKYTCRIGTSVFLAAYSNTELFYHKTGAAAKLESGRKSSAGRNGVDTAIIIQALGWAASLFAVGSYCCKDVRTVRIVNCIAAAFFIAYGSMMGTPAVVVMNATLAVVHLAYLLSNDRIGAVIEKHGKVTAAVFAIYAIACVSWVCASTSMNLSEIVGIVSSVGFVGGFLLPKERPMRTVCSIALVVNIVYAVMIVSPQIAVTNGVSLVVNIVRLFQMQSKQKKQAPGK